MGKTLPILRVNPRAIDRVTGRAYGDDVVQRIKCRWYTGQPVVRIAAIGDGSCLIHSILKSYFPLYANDPSYNRRVKIARDLRRDLADSLSDDNPDYPGKTYYESFNDGIFLILEESDPSFSLERLKRNIDSSGFLGDEVFNYLGKTLGINNIIMTPYSEDLVQESGGELDTLYDPYNVFIGHVGGCHYETIGVLVEGKGIQTVFDIEDSFMVAYRGYRAFSEIRSEYNTIIGKLDIYQSEQIREFEQFGEFDSDDGIAAYLSSNSEYRQLRKYLDQAETIIEEAEALYRMTTEGSDRITLEEMLQLIDDITDVKNNVNMIVP